jgi:hypothetical protein
MGLGEKMIEGTREMFKVGCLASQKLMSNAWLKALEGKVSLSLDAWTSSNNIAFLAIVAHYIANNGELGMYTVMSTFSFLIF